ncbi:MAG: hypothetical protein FWD87_05775 [Spirochaetaceae bacterium]|nr:hypothetical protein [Spirochaetaceae bacterium]
MKKLLLLFSILMFLFAGCQNKTRQGGGANSLEEVLALFEQYWNLGEDRETGMQVLRRFKEDPALVINALTITTPALREQILTFMGAAIASARHSDPTTYAEYTKALELAAGLDLDENSTRMLGFINANIEYWYRH